MGKQHYLSQLYLRGFSSEKDEKNIFCYSKDENQFLSENQDGSIKIKNSGYKEEGFWDTKTEERITEIETKFGGEMKNFRITDDITKLTHINLMKFIMMQLIRSQIAGEIFIETSKSIISLGEMGGLKIKDSEYTSMSLEYFISRIHDESDIEGFGCFRNRKIYLSKVIGKRNFITTNFPFIHDHHGDIYFPLTSRWVVFITGEIDPIITEDESIIYNDFRVSLFNKSFINAHSDNRYIFGERGSDIADMLAL